MGSNISVGELARMHRYLVITVAMKLLVLFGTPCSHAWEPIGFPYQSWGEIYYVDGTENDVEDGFYGSTYAEQGIDVLEMFSGLVNVFVSGGLLVGGEKEKDPWNSKFEPSAGLRWRYIFNTNRDRGPLDYGGVDIREY
jgi:hypothetical protein